MESFKKVIFVIGVSGTGKSTISDALATALGARFIDADDFHSSQNKASMANGVPLTDEMRKGWLDIVCAETNAQAGSVVVACSALKQAYRDAIRKHVENCQFVFLQVGRDVLEHRISNRPGHFMPVSLLESQLQTLQAPTALETDVVTIDGTLPVLTIVQVAANFANAGEAIQ